MEKVHSAVGGNHAARKLTMETWTHQRARVAALARYRPPDDPDLLDAKRDLRESRLAEHIAHSVAEVPPLTDTQRSRLAVLLLGGGADE